MIIPQIKIRQKNSNKIPLTCTFIVLRYQYFYITNAQNAPLYSCKFCMEYFIGFKYFI